MIHLKRQRAVALTALLLALANQRCNEARLTGAAPAADPPPAEDTFELPPVGDPNYTAEVFGTSSGSGQVDMLWVIDDSGSMGPDQANLRENFARFIESFVSTYRLDFKIAVTTTAVYHPENIDSPQWRWRTVNGRFMNFLNQDPDRHAANYDTFASPNGYPAVLTSEMDPAVVVEGFSKNADVGVWRGPDEQGLEPARLALSNDYAHPQNEGFLRENALLSVIVVSDEPEQSLTEGPRLFSAIAAKDNDPASPDYYVRHYMNYFASLKSDPKQFHFTAITGEAKTRGYTEALALAQEMGAGSLGIKALGNEADWAEVLDHLSSAIASATNQVFRLDNIPVISTIRVLVDDVVVPSAPNTWFYSEADNAVVVSHSAAVPPGADITVGYKILR